MATAEKLREVEDQLNEDLRETPRSFGRLGEKYEVSRQAIYDFMHRKGITRPTKKNIKTGKQLLRDLQEKDELTPSEVHRILGISHTTLCRYCAEGILEYRRHPITKWRLIKRRSVEELLRRYGLL
jgi:predicted DNA-binding protein YlxM (UPF0122 family)